MLYIYIYTLCVVCFPQGMCTIFTSRAWKSVGHPIVSGNPFVCGTLQKPTVAPCTAFKHGFETTRFDESKRGDGKSMTDSPKTKAQFGNYSGLSYVSFRHQSGWGRHGASWWLVCRMPEAADIPCTLQFMWGMSQLRCGLATLLVCLHGHEFQFRSPWCTGITKDANCTTYFANQT